MKMGNKLELFVNVQWRVTQLPSGDYMGECDQLNLVLDAKDFEELRGIIHEGMHLLFMHLIRDNELELFLQERGWTPQTYCIPTAPANDDIELEIPMELIFAEKMRDTAHIAH